MSRISTVQIITNGNRGFPYDSVVQIGSVDIDTRSGTMSEGFEVTVRCDTDSWSQEEREYLGDRVSEDDLKNGMPLKDAVEFVKDRLRGKDVASFEIANTFGRYLSFEHWDLTLETSILPSISFRLPSAVRGMDTSKENSFLDRAYARYLTDDPLGLVPGRRTAIDYARVSAMLLLFLRRKGLY